MLSPRLGDRVAHGKPGLGTHECPIQWRRQTRGRHKDGRMCAVAEVWKASIRKILRKRI